jgi:hypothetical protein
MGLQCADGEAASQRGKMQQVLRRYRRKTDKHILQNDGLDESAAFLSFAFGHFGNTNLI